VSVHTREDLRRLFDPVGVFFWGPLPDGSRPETFLSPLRRRWAGRFHLVSAAGGTFGGVPVHSSLDSIPDPLDLAVLSLPVPEVTEAAEACGRKGLRSLVVTGSGFGEMGGEGLRVEQALIGIARRYGMRVMGPNVNLNAFDPMPRPANERIGRIGLITQSGHMGRVIAQSDRHGVAFSRWIPTGNEADLDVADFVEYFAADPDTAVIACYLEGFRDGAKLRRALAAANHEGKPVVVIKVGRNQAATQMASSHTAHLTGSDQVIDGLFRQYGVVRVDDVDELIETSALYAKLRPHPRGTGVALYGISGGALALMADHAESRGIPVPALAAGTQAALHEILPPYLGVANPVDNGNLYRTGTEAQRRRIFELIAADPAVDLLVCALTGVIPGLTDDYAGDILDHLGHAPQPVVLTWNSWLMETPAYSDLVASGVPIFRSFRGCFSALAGLFERDRREAVIGSRDGLEVVPEPVPPVSGPGRLLDAAESSDLLRRYGVELVPERLVTTVDEALAAAIDLGFPVAVKLPLPSLPHKSDAGLVRLGVQTVDQLREAFSQLRERAAALDPGAAAPVLLQRQLSAGVEMVVGVMRDPTLGPAVLVGVGGVLAEVDPDVSVRPLPLTEDDAWEMLADLRGAAVLDGARGAPPVDRAALVHTILAVAALAGAPNERVVELDLNPVIAGPGGAVTVDSLIAVDR
jgi:acetate---CoA ligase (ADP-forming)